MFRMVVLYDFIRIFPNKKSRVFVSSAKVKKSNVNFFYNIECVKSAEKFFFVKKKFMAK